MSDLSVWYLLVDSQGSNYQDSTADKIKIAFSCDVSDLRKAVKAKNSNSLTHCDSIQLKVYRDKNSLNAPLKNLTLLETLINGNEEDNPLLVVVPSEKIKESSKN